jgi:c-di-GMP-binding flagellar brake protein YcgR
MEGAYFPFKESGRGGGNMPWVPRPSERRRFPRFKADVPAIASIVGDIQIGSVRTWCSSISEGGVDAPSLQSLALGELVTLELNLPVSTQPIRVDTIVMRRGTDRCGLEFTSLSNYQRNLIKRYCHLHPKEKHRR